VLTASRVQVAGDVDDLLATHHRLMGARGAYSALPPGVEVIEGEHTDRQSTVVVRDPGGAVPGLFGADLPGEVQRLNLEDLVLAYLGRAGTPNHTETNR
jgi:ABC-2 type transport system ATP-binding protein